MAAILEPFEIIDETQRKNEINMLDVDLKMISELEKYIKITNIQPNVSPFTFDQKISSGHNEIQEIDSRFWNMVDSYSEMVHILS